MNQRDKLIIIHVLCQATITIKHSKAMKFSNIR